MKLSFLTYQFCRFPLEYSFQMAQRYGFDGIELWGARPHGYTFDMNRERLDEIHCWKKRYNIEISMYTPEILAYPYSFVSALAAERSETLNYLIRSAETAAALETEHMQITIPHTGYAADYRTAWEQMVEGVAALTARAEELGVNIVVEALSPSEGNLLTTVDDLDRLRRQVNSPRLKMMLDVVPPVIANEPFSRYFEQFGADMVYIHICNSDGKTELHLQLDDPAGVISMPEMFQIFKHSGYNGWCSLELLAPYFNDPQVHLARAKKVMDHNNF